MRLPKTTLQPILAPALQTGDTIAVISPAAPSTAESLEQGIAYLSALGYKPKLMPHAKASRYYLAGTDADRLSDLHAAFADPEIRGVLSARGGYGCMRLLPNVDWELIQANPKVFIGFSDLTTLLLPIFERTGLVCFHGPMLTSNLIEGDTYSQESLWQQVTGQVSYPFTVQNLSQYECFHPGTATGRLIGGNLSLLTALCGTPYQPDTRGALLFIEDWHERYYTLDRQFTQLKLAGMFDDLAGLILCDFTEIEETDRWADYPLKALLKDLTATLQVPTGWGLSVGHGDQSATLPVGTSARFEASSGRLEILSAPVALNCR